jgi:membrane-associated phospholipid phosphatase
VRCLGSGSVIWWPRFRPVAAIGLTLKSDDMDGLKQLAMSGALAVGTTEVLKRAVNTARPDGSPRGFPSAHASVAFVSAAYVQRRYGWEWAAPMYGLAAATAYTRVSSHNHFAKDVVGGALIGIGSAFLFTHPLGRNTLAALAPSEAGGVKVMVFSQW